MNNLRNFQLCVRNQDIQERLAEVLGSRKEVFISTLTSAVSEDSKLQKAEPASIIQAALQAAALDLPVVKSLQYAALLPYYDNDTKKTLCQLQIMRNGWLELAQRSGQVFTIVNEVVHEGELVKKNKFKEEYEFDESARLSDKAIGYMAYTKLVNGFSKTIYWDIDECKNHALRFSKTYQSNKGLWVTDFDAMALKTVLKRLISKYMPKSITMQGALNADQAIFGDNASGLPMRYLDNPERYNDIQDVQTDKYDDLVNEKKEQMRENGNKAPEMP